MRDTPPCYLPFYTRFAPRYTRHIMLRCVITARCVALMHMLFHCLLRDRYDLRALRHATPLDTLCYDVAMRCFSDDTLIAWPLLFTKRRYGARHDPDAATLR